MSIHGNNGRIQGNNGIFGVDRIQKQAVDEKQEIYLEWPNTFIPVAILMYVMSFDK